MPRLAALALLLAACGSERATPEVEPEPEATEIPSPESDDAPEVDDPPDDPPAPTALELPEEIPEIEQLPVRRLREGEAAIEAAIEYDAVQHPDADVTRTLAEVARRVAMSGTIGETGNDCRAELRHEHLVSYLCRGNSDENTARGGWLFAGWSALFVIAEGSVRPASMEEAFLEGGLEAARARADARCEAEYARIDAAFFSEAEDRPVEPPDFDCDSDRAFVGLTAEGLKGLYPSTQYATATSFTVPWTELREYLRSDGVLAPVLTDAEPAAPARVAPSEVRAWAVSPLELERAAVRRWARLPREVSGGLTVQTYSGGIARLLLPEPDAARASALAERLDARAEPLGEGESGQPIQWMRTRRDLNVRRARADYGSDVNLVVPSGTVLPVVGFEPGMRWGSAHTALASGDISTRWVTEDEGCVVSPPESAGAAGEVLVAKVRLRRAGRRPLAALLVSAAQSGTRVAIHPLDEETCDVGDALATVTVEGAPLDVRLAGTTEHGGHSLLVIGTRVERGELQYSVRRVGDPDVLWSHTFEVHDDRRAHVQEEPERLVRTSETADGAYFPLAYRDGSDVVRLRWEDDALVATEPPSAEP